LGSVSEWDLLSVGGFGTNVATVHYVYMKQYKYEVVIFSS